MKFTDWLFNHLLGTTRGVWRMFIGVSTVLDGSRETQCSSYKYAAWDIMDFLFTMVNLIAKGIIYPTSLVKIFGALLFLVAFRAIRDYRRRGGLPYPPGPRPLPVIGNLLDIPKKFSWLAYTNFSKTHVSQPFFATVPL